MSWLIAFHILEWAACILMLGVILRRRFAPVVALAWLSVVFLEPLLGTCIYALIGDRRLGRARLRHRHYLVQSMRSAHVSMSEIEHVTRPQVDPASMPLILQAEQCGGLPIVGGNHVELLSDTLKTINQLIEDIDNASHHVHMVFYIFAPDEIGWRVAKALARATSRGVTCRLLADAAGSRHLFARRGLAQWMNNRGMQVIPALPVRPLRRGLHRLDLRNHRKCAIIDGQIAYSGSQNIVGQNFGRRRAGPWIDLMGRFEGPVVTQIQTVFLEDWAYETVNDLEDPKFFPSPSTSGQIAAQTVPTGPGKDPHVVPKLLVSALNTAQRKIIITSPYFIPDEPTMLALSMAAQRNVQVDIVLPYRSDHPLVNIAGRAYFQPLLENGVNLYLHQKGLLHAKTLTVDDAFAVVGSTNMDIRSFYLNFEINVLLYGSQITRELRFAQTRYLSDADKVDLAQWARRPIWRRYVENAASLLSPLL